MADLKIKIANIQFINPVLPASGPLVRDGKSILEVSKADVGGIVTKTISIRPAQVMRPCLAYVGEGGLVNCELWSDLALEQWIEKELPFAKECGLPIIASIGYSADEISFLAKKLHPYVDGFEISTHYSAENIRNIIEAVKAAKENTDRPIFLKLSPHALNVSATALAAQEAGADGIVAINSVGPVLVFDVKKQKTRLGSTNGYGWLSGKPIKHLALRFVAEIVKVVDIPVIGCGGISTADDALAMLLLGASAVQICTSAILYGLKIFKEVIEGINNFLEKNKYSSVTQIIGLASKTESVVSMKNPPEIDYNKCKLCGSCVTSCVYHALQIKDKKLYLTPALCYRCGLCVTRCPTEALHIP